jgi:hypothetical protein
MSKTYLIFVKEATGLVWLVCAKINLDFLLRKIGVSLNYKMELRSLHIPTKAKQIPQIFLIMFLSKFIQKQNISEILPAGSTKMMSENLSDLREKNCV